MSLGSIFSTGNVLTLSPEQTQEEQLYMCLHYTSNKGQDMQIHKSNMRKEKQKILLMAMVVSSFPWVKTTTRCLFVLTLGKAWAFLAISLMSLVYRENTHQDNRLTMHKIHQICSTDLVQMLNEFTHLKLLLFSKCSCLLWSNTKILFYPQRRALHKHLVNTA